MPGVLAACIIAQFCLLSTQRHLAAAKNEPASNGFVLRDGDRVVFYGDSITEQGNYTSAVETFVLTRYPGLKVSFINSGWAGDLAWGGDGGMSDERFRRDVIAHRPTVVTIMLGMNDAYYTGYDAKTCQAFKDSLKGLIIALQKELPDVRITLLGTSPFDNVSPGPQPKWEKAIDGGYNSVLRRFSRAAQEVAKEHDVLFVDMNQPLVDLLEQAHKTNHDLAGQLIPDRIHPGPAAGLVMAAHLLTAWNAPDVPSVVHVDAATCDIVSTTGSTVTEAMLGGGLRWTQQDAALPFPSVGKDALVDLVLQCSPQLKALAGRRLRITNLPTDKALLRIDGQPVGVFSAAEWADGVDLSLLQTPMNRQAEDVEKLTQLRNQLQFTRWRRLQTPFSAEIPPDVTKAVEELSQLDHKLAAMQRTAAQPIPKRFELVFSSLRPCRASHEPYPIQRDVRRIKKYSPSKLLPTP